MLTLQCLVLCSEHCISRVIISSVIIWVFVCLLDHDIKYYLGKSTRDPLLGSIDLRPLQISEHFPRAPQGMLHMYYVASHDSPVSLAAIPCQEVGEAGCEPQAVGDRSSPSTLQCDNDVQGDSGTPVRLRHCVALHKHRSEQTTAVVWVRWILLGGWGVTLCLVAVLRPGETLLLPASGPWKWMPWIRKPGDQRNANYPKTDCRLCGHPSFLTSHWLLPTAL